MTTRTLAGLTIASLRKTELLDLIVRRAGAGQQTVLTTPYSEFLYHCLKDQRLVQLLNQADVAVPDGIGLFWAARFFEGAQDPRRPLWRKIVLAWVRAFYLLSAIALRPSYIRSAFPEKIPGSELIWDIAALAEHHRWSVFLIGGYGDTPERAVQALRRRHPNLKVAGTSNRDAADEGAVSEIARAGADVVLVAFGPFKQERWILEHRQELPAARLLVGLGGTFDYLAGVKREPPRALRSWGFEWLWRLLTQPRRIGRIWHATAGLVSACVKHRVVSSLPFRQNAVAVVLNAKGEVLTARRNPSQRGFGHASGRFANYWQLPQGGAEIGERPEETAARELMEETGITEVLHLFTSEHLNRYDWPLDIQPIWRARYRGQEQRVVYFRLLGDERQLRPDGREFVDFRWVKPEQLPSQLHEERAALARQVERELSSRLAGAHAPVV